MNVVSKTPRGRIVVSLTPAEAKALAFAASNAIEDNEMNAMHGEANLLRRAVEKIHAAQRGK